MTMTQDTRDWLMALAVGVGLVLLILFLFGGRRAFAQADPAMCPPGAKSCKILTITPEEEQTLAGTDMIWDQALWARQQFGPLLKAWRDKFQAAPPGKPYQEPASAK